MNKEKQRIRLFAVTVYTSCNLVNNKDIFKFYNQKRVSLLGFCSLLENCKILVHSFCLIVIFFHKSKTKLLKSETIYLCQIQLFSC